MRVSSVMVPSESSGALKSTRTKALTLCFVVYGFTLDMTRGAWKSPGDPDFPVEEKKSIKSEKGGNPLEQIDATVAVTPFVVVPRYELEKSVAQTHTGTGVENRGVRTMNEVEDTTSSSV